MKLNQLFLVLALLCFQSCSKLEFAYVEGSLESKNGSFSVNDSLQFTDLNKEVQFNIEVSGDATGMNSSLAADSQKNQLSSQNGTLEIIDLAKNKFSYMPKFGFRGKDEFLIYARDIKGDSVSGLLTVVVANPLTDLQPAMAVRGVGCVACHLNSASNLITDMGLGGDSGTRDYSMGGARWKGGSPYGDYGGEAFATIKITSDKASVLVPKARVPASVQAVLGDISLAQYFKTQLEKILVSQPKKAEDSITLNTKVIERTSMYIGAPTAEQLSQAFGLNTNKMVFFRDGDKSKPLSGMVTKGPRVFQNDDVLTCEGDLALDGTLLLKDLKLVSATGCRLYVTGAVFIDGEITYVNKTQNTNLQITSSRGIFMGMGNVVNPEGTATCETSGWYFNRMAKGETADFSKNYKSSFLHRVRTLWTLPFTPLREKEDPLVIGDALLLELEEVQMQAGYTLQDATCTPKGRDISFERILLNAPNVQSRYTGQFKGSIIAEYALMSLSKFSFGFDEVFSNNAILPMIDSSTFLQVK